MRHGTQRWLLPTVALLLAAATQQATAQCSGTTASKTEVIGQPVQTSQVEQPTDSQSEQADSVNETVADSVTQVTTEQHPNGATQESARESPAEHVATSGKSPTATTIDATLDGAIQQVQKGTQAVKTGATTVTQAVQALDELLKAFDKELKTVEQSIEPR